MLSFISTGLNENNYVAAIFLDISKAFDSVTPSILLAKLSHYGIRGVALSWFKSFLSNRKQKVKVNGVWSNTLQDIVLGVLQGSILGVLLFLIFINDLPSELTSNFYKIIFADDTSALAKNPSLTELVDFCNIEICKLGDWFKANKLLLNTGKTKLMIFSPNSRVDTKVNISLDGTQLIQYPNDKDKFIRTLGFFIDDKLNLKEHFKKVLPRISTSIFFMRRAQGILNQRSLKLIYFSRVHSHLLYLLPLTTLAVESDLKKLLKLFKKAVRIMYVKNIMTTTTHYSMTLESYH